MKDRGQWMIRPRTEEEDEDEDENEDEDEDGGVTVVECPTP
jgi:hypothetical protein